MNNDTELLCVIAAFALLIGVTEIVAWVRRYEETGRERRGFEVSSTADRPAS